MSNKGKLSGTYSGYNGNGMSRAEAEDQKRAVETLNAKVGARGREVTVVERPDGKFNVEERYKK